MCFFPRKNVIKARVARKPILAYKALKVNGAVVYSPLRYMEWKAGRVHKAKLKPKISKGSNIHVGLHCFKTKKKALTVTSTVFPVLIPKGALYYENDSQFVSNQMVLLTKDPATTDAFAKLIKNNF